MFCQIQVIWEVSCPVSQSYILQNQVTMRAMAVAHTRHSQYYKSVYHQNYFEAVTVKLLHNVTLDPIEQGGATLV